MENTDKKMTIKALIEKGKANNGKISTQDIDAAILEMDFDIEELDKLYETIENQNIEIIDDFNSASLENIDFDMDIPKTNEMNVIAADDIFIYVNERGKDESITEVFKIISQDDINIYVLRNNYGKEMIAWKDEDGNNRMFNISDVTRDPADISFNYIFECISDNIDSVKEKYAEMGLSDKNIVKFAAKEG